ncbi:MAG TPA: plasmid stabilization protein [Flavobacteriales bacterium]|jgi:plasmid stabilization system protein ParE|nr:plasmid stabilization protein [Flavobacteriales bacterium]
MAGRAIIWTHLARQQRRAVLSYWAKRNKSNFYSKKLLKTISQRTLQIAENPMLFRSANRSGVRAASLGNYTLFYKYNDLELVVLLFWDNRQDPEKLVKLLNK